MIVTTISHYALLRKLGSGGMGEVYEAEDLKLQRHVALKFLPETLAHDPHALDRFRGEALALSAVNHPNICTIYEIDDSTEVPFIAMELLQGRPLHQVIADRPLSLDAVLELGAEIADGLDVAHAHGIIHRDIKPSNIFITSRRQAKILDFGLAKLVPEQASPSHGAAEGVTASTIASVDMQSAPGGMAGTIAYMSPEQARGDDLDTRTDLFSLGIVLYQMATATLPFSGETPAVIFDAILNRDPPSVLEVKPGLPPQLAEIIGKALEKNRELRYQSAADLRADLQRLGLETGSAQHTFRNAQAASFLKWRRSRVAAGLMAVAVVAVVAASLVYFRWPKRPPVVTEKDTIVLADFINRTGDPVFDDTLKEALETDLAQSPFLRPMPDRRLRQTLRSMGRPGNTPIIGEVGREVCVRDNSKVAIEGTIAQLGSQYVLGLTAVNCNTGDVIARAEQTAPSKEEVLKALGKADSSIRRKLGESLASIQKFDVPLGEISTPSLEAFQDFARGYRTFAAKGEREAIPFFEHAVKVDPEFAMAFHRLAVMHGNIGDSDHAREYLEKAYRFRERASEHERLYIEATYEGATGDSLKALEIWKVAAQSYPQDFMAHYNLCLAYLTLGRGEEALAECQQVLKLAPWVAEYRARTAHLLLVLNRRQEAKALLDDAVSHGLDYPGLRQEFYMYAFLNGDWDGMQREVERAKGSPYEPLLYELHADTYAYFGRVREANALRAKELNLYVTAADKSAKANAYLSEARREVLYANSANARQKALAALRNSTEIPITGNAALVLAMAGDLSTAERLATQMGKKAPTNTWVNSVYLPVIRAAVYLQRGEPGNALQTTGVVLPYEKTGPGMFARFLRSQAWLQLHKPAEALVEIRALLDQRDCLGSEPIKPAGVLQLARIYAAAGQASDAKSAYRDFLNLWQDADSDIPLLAQAKAEYANLK